MHWHLLDLEQMRTIAAIQVIDTNLLQILIHAIRICAIILVLKQGTYMETFDDICCEEYSAAFGTDTEQFEEWMNTVEELMVEGVNADLRELAEMEMK